MNIKYCNNETNFGIKFLHFWFYIYVLKNIYTVYVTNMYMWMNCVLTMSFNYLIFRVTWKKSNNWSIITKAWIHGTEWRWSEGRGRGDSMKGEGISKRTCMYNPWTQTTVWRWPEGKGSRGWEEGVKWGKLGTSAIVSTIKIKLLWLFLFFRKVFFNHIFSQKLTLFESRIGNI